MYKFKHLLMNQTQPIAEGGAATPPPGVLFDNPAPAGGTPTPPPAATPPNPINIPQNWKDALPDDIKSSPLMNLISDVPGLAKAYFNAQKMVGAEKIAIPSQNAPKEAWSEVYQKLGLPKSEAEYKLELDQTVKMDKDLEASVIKLAHEQGIMPKQAKALLEHLWKTDIQAQEKEVERYQQEVKAQLDNLKNEWGDAYTNKVAQAKAALREYADPETQKLIRESGLGNNPALIKLLSKVGETLSEGKIKGEGGGGSALTPAQAQGELDSIYKNPKHPYFDKAHPEHAQAKAKVSQLFAMMTTSQKST